MARVTDCRLEAALSNTPLNVSSNPDMRKIFKNHVVSVSAIPTGSCLPPFLRDFVKIVEDTEVNGTHSANKFLQQIQFNSSVYESCWLCLEKPDLSSRPQKTNIPRIEFIRYRSLARIMQLQSTNEKTELEQVTTAIKAAKDFLGLGFPLSWQHYRKFHSTTGFWYALLLLFTYYNELPTEDRSRLDPQTRIDLLFLCE